MSITSAYISFHCAMHCSPKNSASQLKSSTHKQDSSLNDFHFPSRIYIHIGMNFGRSKKKKSERTFGYTASPPSY